MAEQDVLYRKEDGIGIITLNRPDKLNALTEEMNLRIATLAEEVKNDDEVKAVILTGAGRAFCAGTDISGGETPARVAERRIQEINKRVSTFDPGSLWYLNSVTKPTICAINGAAVGLGAEYTLHCDVRIASESARWGEVFVLRGLIPDTGAGTYLLPRIVGLSKALELVFSGEIIDAQEMLRIGLVSKVVPNDELLPAAMEMAKKLSRGAPLAIKLIKQLMYKGLARTPAEHIEEERYYFQLTTQTEDNKEGIRSFLEKREPRWQGK